MEGIRQLAQSDDPRTLKILKTLYKRETEPDVKQLVAKVARQLKEQPAPVPEERSIFDIVEAEHQLENHPEAEQILENASETFYDGYLNDSWYLLQQAIRLYPPYRDDEDVIQFAVKITRQEPRLAIQYLMSRRFPRDYFSLTNAEDTAPEEKLSAGKVAMDVAIYAMVVFASIVIPFWFIAPSIARFFDVSSSAMLIYSIVAGLVVAGVAIIAQLFIAGVAHLLATRVMDGSGYFNNLIHKFRTPMISFFILNGLFEIFVYLFRNFAVYSPFVGLINLALALLHIGWLSVKVSDNYGISRGKSIVTMIAGVLLIGIAYYATGYVFTVFLYVMM